MSKRILIVEDENSIQHVLQLNLEMEGYDVVCASSGKEALAIIQGQYFDLILLDIMLPEVSGLEICQKVRLTNKDIAIIFVSAKSNVEDRIFGLKVGADDYITKPFSLEELILRIQKLINRTNKAKLNKVNEYQFGDNYVNFSSFEAKGTTGGFYLTKKEAQLLQLLIERKNEAVSRELILKTVWGYDIYPNTRTIDNFLLSFRKYFEKNPKNPEYFKSVRGIGYKFQERAS